MLAFTAFGFTALLFGTCASSSLPPETDLQKAFVRFLNARGRSYPDEKEYQMRYGLWKKKALQAKTINSWTVYWGMTDKEESNAKEIALKSFPLDIGTAAGGALETPWTFFPNDYVSTAMDNGADWRNKLVTPVKNQGSEPYCGTFMRAAVAEGQWARFYSLVSLSEEQLVDCVGWTGDQYSAMINTGLESYADYPYRDVANPPQCTQDLSKIVAHGYTGVTFPPKVFGAEQQAAFIYHNGPVGTGVASKIFESCDDDHWVTDCSLGSLDHAITLVGFGNHPSRGRYWIIKNSWGQWQDNGFAYAPLGKQCSTMEDGQQMVMLRGWTQYYETDCATLTGFNYANCDGTYKKGSDSQTWVKDDRKICLDHGVCVGVDWDCDGGNFGSRPSSFWQTNFVPCKECRTLTGFNYAGCDGTYYGYGDTWVSTDTGRKICLAQGACVSDNWDCSGGNWGHRPQDFWNSKFKPCNSHESSDVIADESVMKEVTTTTTSMPPTPTLVV